MCDTIGEHRFSVTLLVKMEALSHHKCTRLCNIFRYKHTVLFKSEIGFVETKPHESYKHHILFFAVISKSLFYYFFIGAGLLYNIVLVSTNSKVDQLSV